jgi:hypothetical protein
MNLLGAEVFEITLSLGEVSGDGALLESQSVALIGTIEWKGVFRKFANDTVTDLAKAGRAGFL